MPDETGISHSFHEAIIMARSTRHPTENTLAQMGTTMRRYMATGTLRRAGGETLERAASLSSRPTDPPSLKGPSLDGLPNPVPADAYYPKVTILEPARARSSRPGPAARHAAPFQTSESARVIAFGVAQVTTAVRELAPSDEVSADRWMTVKEAARYARCHTETIRRAYWSRQLRVASFGVRNVRIRFGDLMAWLESGAKTRP
jgi:excisionase family DNA binding protein